MVDPSPPGPLSRHLYGEYHKGRGGAFFARLFFACGRPTGSPLQVCDAWGSDGKRVIL